MSVLHQLYQLQLLKHHHHHYHQSIGPWGYCNLDGIYDSTNLICLFTNVKPLNFAKASKEEKWIQAMDEIQATEKITLRNLFPFEVMIRALESNWCVKLRRMSIVK